MGELLLILNYFLRKSVTAYVPYEKNYLARGINRTVYGIHLKNPIGHNGTEESHDCILSTDTTNKKKRILYDQ